MSDYPASATWEAAPARGRVYLRLSPPAWIIMIVSAVVIGMLTPNSLLTTTSLLLLPVFAQLVWRVGEPPILFFALSLQWLQASMKIFQADLRGLTVVQLFQGWGIDEAIWLSLGGLAVLALGMRLGMRGIVSPTYDQVYAEAEQYSLSKLWRGYLLFLVGTFVARDFVWLVPGLAQILLALLNLKWVMFYLLAFVVVMRRQRWEFLMTATVIELVIGFTGFFSEYKQVFFVLILVFLTVSRRLTMRNVMRIVTAGLLVFYLSIVWSSVKIEYREYVSLGTGRQEVSVPMTARIGKILDLYSDLDMTTLENGLQTLAQRVAYVDYFAMVLERVPRQVQHEGGELWGQALAHVLMPRLFFPEKASLESDTVINEKYTGQLLIVQGGRDTNVPLGYMTESYIDFGTVGMFAPLLLIGLAWGVIYKYLISRARYPIFAYGIAVAVLIHANQLEISSAKLLGGMLMGFIVLALAQKIIVPRVSGWLRVRAA